MSSKYRHLYQNNRNLLLLNYPGRVRSQITSVVCQIQRFDFDCNIRKSVSRKTGIHAIIAQASAAGCVLEVLNVKVTMFYATILLLYLIKVMFLKYALAC
jgi:hypothetical protein